MGKPHPAFNDAARGRQWIEKIHPLWIYLVWEAGERPATVEQIETDSGWAWRILPHGAVVAVRKRLDLDRYELRLSRVDVPTDMKGWSAFDKEVKVFLDNFGLVELDGETVCEEPGRDFWQLKNDPHDEGKCAIRFLELREGEIRPGTGLCPVCYTTTGEVRTVILSHGPTCPEHTEES